MNSILNKVKYSLNQRKIRRLNRSLAGDSMIALLLIFIGAFMALPLVYAVNQAFKPLDEIFLFPPRFFVRNPTLSNFSDLFIIMSNSWVPFSRYIFNTVFITTVGTLGHVLVASMAAFPLAKHNFKGKTFLFTIVVLSLMFAREVTAIPNYLIVSGLGFVDSHAALILPALAFPLGLYLMRQFMTQIHDNMLEAARIDGANEISTLFRIVMPMVKPAWLTLIILSFQSLWGLTGGVFIYREELKTLPFALQQILLGGIARTGPGAAVGVIMMIVPLSIFIVTQSNVIQTMGSSGIKE